MTDQPLLECVDLHRSFGAVRALGGASISVQSQSVHGLVGHNGAGKSTLVKIISGLMGWDSGTVSFDGHSVMGPGRRAAIRRGIWSAPQELMILPGMSVADNVNVGDEPSRRGVVRWREMRGRAEETLRSLGINDVSPRSRIDDLRPAQKRMVMIAMAVSRDCRLLILDEPTASVGTDESGPLIDLVESLPARGVTVLYVSHRLDEVERLCDRVTVMRDGLTLETLERGAFSAKDLIGRMVADMPERPPRTARAPSGASAVSVRGLWGVSLRGLDVDIRAGSITGFAGLVGSGADELLDIIAGARKPLAGTVVIGEKPVSFGTPAGALRAGIGYLPGTRAAGALVALTVRENVLASSLGDLSIAGYLPKRRERRRAYECVSPFGLEGRIERKLAELSGGNQQKVLIARLIAADAKVLVVNDPTAGVDVRARVELHAMLRGAAEAGRAVIVRCSEPEELLDLADTIHVLAGGRLSGTFNGTDVELSRLLEASSSSGAGRSSASVV